MNIAGFILFLLFAAVAFFIAKIMWSDMNSDSASKYRDYHTATVTVVGTGTERSCEGEYEGYYYQVEFIDYDGNEAVGRSETFRKRRMLQNNQTAEVYYWQKEETEVSKKLQGFVDGAMAAMTSTLLGKTYEPDSRPRYRIHFCDERVYEKEKKSGSRFAIGCAVFGCVMVVLAIVILLKG